MNATTITEKQANQAREKYAETLRNAGVHALMVDEVKQKGNKSFAVIALTEKPRKDLPRDLEIKSGKTLVKVPLIVRVSPRYQLE